MKTQSLTKKTVVLTGASSGIGKAAALLFAKEGSNLVLAARSEQLLQELVDQCEEMGAKAIAVPTDVTDRASVANLLNEAITTFGGVDVWINNAAVGAVGRFTDVPLDAHEQVIRTNLFGPLYGTYEAVAYFKEKGKGIVINTNSTGAFVGNPYTVSYSASKFGLRGLSEALRYELKPFSDIYVCELYAGFVDTPAFAHAGNYVGKETKPAKPLVDPEDMAKALVALAKKPKPSVHIGIQDRFGRLGHFVSAELTGFIMEKVMSTYFKKAKVRNRSDGNLYGPDYDKTSIHGGYS